MDFGGRRREDDQVGRVEVGAVKQIEDFGAKLQGEAFAKLGVFEAAEVPGGEAGTAQVSRPRLPSKPLLAGGARNAEGLNHCYGLPMIVLP